VYRDNQRRAVYCWEDSIRKRWPELNQTLTLQECREWVAKVWADYRPGEEPPTVKDGRGTRIARGGRWTVNLPHWSRQTIVVLHEITHSLATPSQTKEGWHGKAFAQLVLELWNHYAGIPWTEAKRIGVNQRPRRVQFATQAATPQRPSREWMAWYKAKKSLQKDLDDHVKLQPSKYEGESK